MHSNRLLEKKRRYLETARSLRYVVLPVLPRPRPQHKHGPLKSILKKYVNSRGAISYKVLWHDGKRTKVPPHTLRSKYLSHIEAFEAALMEN